MIPPERIVGFGIKNLECKKLSADLSGKGVLPPPSFFMADLKQLENQRRQLEIRRKELERSERTLVEQERTTLQQEKAELDRRIAALTAESTRINQDMNKLGR